VLEVSAVGAVFESNLLVSGDRMGNDLSLCRVWETAVYWEFARSW
jgi:hypothetical protein